MIVSSVGPHAGQTNDPDTRFNVVNYGNVTEDLVQIITSLPEEHLQRVTLNAQAHRCTIYSFLWEDV